MSSQSRDAWTKVIQQTVLAKKHKYRAKPKIVDGIRFASTAEARRYQELKHLQAAGEIKDLELQPVYPLMAPGRGAGGPYERVHLGNYIADFRYRRGRTGILVVEDVKGVKTPLYRWKKKHVEAQYDIQIQEV
jgi:hypothetical protein